MLKRYNLIKQLKSYHKAFDAVKVKCAEISESISTARDSKKTLILAETLSDSLAIGRASYSAILKTCVDKIDESKQNRIVFNRRINVSPSQSEILARLKSIFADKKCAKVSFRATGLVAFSDDSLTNDNLTADITSNPLIFNKYNLTRSELTNSDNIESTDIESIRDQFAAAYDYVTITFDPPITTLDDELITSFSDTVTAVITNSRSGLSPDVNDSSSIDSGSNATGTSSVSELDKSVTAVDSSDVIPEPPAIPDVTEFLNQLNALGEQTFESIGLGGWTPVGIVQQAFEYLHVVLGIPWWTAIIIGTIVIRAVMFPLVVIAQRNAAKMSNNMPGMQAIQLKMTEARQSGNQLEAARYSQELMMFMKEKELNPLKNMIVPLAQMPIFISFFMGLRQMANVPVASMTTGGLFWFTDLTMPDQFFALPIITSLTLWATIELGTDAAKLNSQNLQTMKYVLRALPLVIIPFTLNFPGAILCYWVATNFISLAQVGFLKIPTVRDYFGIEPTVAHDPALMPIKNKGFVGGIKDSWTNIKITKELEERRRIDDLQFQRAGKGPIVKTYKFDPTKVTAASIVNVKKM